MSLPGPFRPLLVLLCVAAGCAPGDDPAAPTAARPRTLRGMIAFTSDRGGSPSLYAMRPDGTGLVPIPVAAQVDDPAISPEGDRVAFTAVSEDGSPDVAVMTIGGPPEPLTPEVPDQRPTWSPDGTRLAFEAFTGRTFDLVVADLGGGGVRPLVDGRGDQGAPAWSPDGRRIAFVDDADGDPDLYLADVATGEVERLTDLPGEDLFPSWSPDGSRIAFSREGDIAVIDLAGGEPRTLAPHPATDTDPVWSPDGERIAFESTREGGDTSDIFVMFADGTGVLRLTHDDADDEDPSWV